MGDFYYVDSVVDTDGLGNSYATNQSGNSFATLSDTNVYGTVQQAIADGASDDDIIVISDASSYASASADVAYAGGLTTSLQIICATAADCGVRSTGALESTTGSGYDVEFNGLINIDGLDLTSEDLFNASASGANVIFNNLTVKLNIISNLLQLAWAGSFFEFNDVTLDLNHSSNSIFINNGSVFVMNGGSVIFTTSTTSLKLTSLGFDNGGGKVRITGTDLAAITGTNSYLIMDTGSHRINDDAIDIHIDKCVLGVALTGFHEETFQCDNQKILVTNSVSSGDAEYQYYFHTRGGIIQDATNIYRNESTPYEESQAKVSWKCVTDTNASIATPFEFEMHAPFAALSDAGVTDKLRLYFASAYALDDKDVYAKLTYPDGTNKYIFNTVHSLATSSDVPSDPLRTAGALSVDSGSDWRDGASALSAHNEYYLDLDTVGDAGADCVPLLEIFVAKTSATTGIYFDTTIDVTT